LDLPKYVCIKKSREKKEEGRVGKRLYMCVYKTNKFVGKRERKKKDKGEKNKKKDVYVLYRMLYPGVATMFGLEPMSVYEKRNKKSLCSRIDKDAV
jgi:hypothetical protein